MIPAQNYQQRRARLAERAQHPLIVIAGGDLVQKTSDETYDFEQDGYFYYLTGINEPGWILVIDTQRGAEFLISTNESSYHNDIWEDNLTSEQITSISGVQDIKTRRDGWAFLRYQCSNYQDIGSIVPHMRFSRPFGMFINPAKTMLVERLKRIHKDANLIDVSAHIRAMRTTKEPEEIAEIRKAIDLTAAGFAHVQSNLQTYTNELDVYSDLTHFFMSRKGEHGYKPVIAAGSNAAKIHYKNNNQPIIQNDYLLIDAGARVNRYTADVTRSIPIGTPIPRKQAIAAEVRAAYHEAINFVGPGVKIRDLELHIEQVIGKSLIKLGLTSSLLRKHIREYYPHGISHHLGIDVHDSCDYDAPLQAGSVITIEPGIYSPADGIGIRHENDVLITENGVEVLTERIL